MAIADAKTGFHRPVIYSALMTDTVLKCRVVLTRVGLLQLLHPLHTVKLAIFVFSVAPEWYIVSEVPGMLPKLDS